MNLSVSLVQLNSEKERIIDKSNAVSNLQHVMWKEAVWKSHMLYGSVSVIFGQRQGFRDEADIRECQAGKQGPEWERS